MSKDLGMDSRPTLERVLKEDEVNNCLRNWQNTIQRGEKMPAKDAARIEFFDSLYLLPEKFKSLILQVRLDPRDSRMPQYQEDLRNLRLSSVDTEGLVYVLQVLTPRRTPLGDIAATHGSQVRERLFAVGEIKTMGADMGGDPETKDTTSIRINPADIGALSVDKSFGSYWVFPRQIEKIELSEWLPRYLRPEQAQFVEDFYSFGKK